MPTAKKTSKAKPKEKPISKNNITSEEHHSAEEIASAVYNNNYIMYGAVAIAVILLGLASFYFFLGKDKDANPGQNDNAQVLDTNVYRTNPFTETVSEWPREAVGIVPEFKYGAYSNGSQSELDNGSYVWTILFNALDDNAYQKYIEDFKAAGWNLDTDDSIGTGYIYAANSEGYSVQASFTEDKLVLTIIQSNND